MTRLNRGCLSAFERPLQRVHVRSGCPTLGPTPTAHDSRHMHALDPGKLQDAPPQARAQCGMSEKRIRAAGRGLSGWLADGSSHPSSLKLEGTRTPDSA